MRIIIILILGSTLFSCRVQKPKSSISDKQETSSVEIPDTTQIEETPLPPDVPEPPDTVDIAIHRLLPTSIRIMGVGDMMIGTNFPDDRYLPADSGRSILSFVSDTLAKADITFGNLEGVLLNTGGTPKKCKNPAKCYVFRMPVFMADNFKRAGFNVLSVANNHSGDLGEKGRLSTKNTLEAAGINFAGYDTKPYTIFRKGAITYGFAAFSPNKGTASINEVDIAKGIVAHLDSLTDIVIVSFHGGAEGKNHEHVTRKTEFFYGENRGNVYEFSHELIDVGADVIFGHGPHVVRAIEVYKGRFIAYSLGNFSTYARFNLSGPNAFAPIVDIQISPSGEFLSGKIISAIQTGLGIPKIDYQNRAANRIRELSKIDFPEAEIIVEDSGVISYIQQ